MATRGHYELRIIQLQEKEVVCRDEISFMFARGLRDLLVRMKHDAEGIRLVERMKASKRHEEVKSKQQRLQRRILALENEESKARIDVLKQEGLRVENIIRVLEKNVREDVFVALYDAAQRQKYYNKTLTVILKNEGGERREILNAERYAFLVLRQAYDQEVVKLSRERFQKQVREKQTKMHDDIKSSRALSRLTQKSMQTLKSHDRVRRIEKAETDATLSPEHFANGLVRVERKEEKYRDELRAAEHTTFNVIVSSLAYALNQDRTVLASVSEAIAERQRMKKDWDVRRFLKEEQELRAKVLVDEANAWMSFERQERKHRQKTAREHERDLARHMAHHKRLVARQEHIAREQSIIDKVLLDESPVHVLAPMPPSVLPGRAFTSRHTGEDRVQQKEDAHRKQLRREEATDFQHIRFLLQTTGKERHTTAKQRREARATESIKRIEEKIVYENERTASARRLQRKQKMIRDMQNVEKDEKLARYDMSHENDKFWAELTQVKSTTVGEKLIASILRLIELEGIRRKEVIQLEAKRRHGHVVASRMVNPERKKIIPAPAPLPPVTDGPVRHLEVKEQYKRDKLRAATQRPKVPMPPRQKPRATSSEHEPHGPAQQKSFERRYTRSSRSTHDRKQSEFPPKKETATVKKNEPPTTSPKTKTQDVNPPKAEKNVPASPTRSSTRSSTRSPVRSPSSDSRSRSSSHRRSPSRSPSSSRSATPLSRRSSTPSTTHSPPPPEQYADDFE